MTLIVPVFAHVLTPPSILCRLVYENGADVSVPSPETNLAYLPVLKMTVGTLQWTKPVEPTDVRVSEREENVTQCSVLNARVKASSRHPIPTIRNMSSFQDPLAGACRNSSIQHMQHKVCFWFEQFRRHTCSWPGQQGFVHRSKWGLGFYLVESARKGDLIIGIICPINISADVGSMSTRICRWYNLRSDGPFPRVRLSIPQLSPHFHLFLFILSTVLLQHIQTDNTCSNSTPYSPSTELQRATNQDTSTTLPETMPTSVLMV